MSRFLHRPMFRRGGSTGEGITSGLRRGYALGSTGAQRDYLEAKRTNDPTDQRVKPRDSSGADFWLNFGTNILAQPGGRPILQTLGTAAKEPLSQFQKSRASQEKMDWERDWEQKGRDIKTKQFDEEMDLAKDQLRQDWKIAELEAQGEKQFIEEQINNYWDPLVEAETDPDKKKLLLQEKAADKYNVIVMGADISDKYKILSNAAAFNEATNLADDELGNTINPTTGAKWLETDPGYSKAKQKLISFYLAELSRSFQPELKADGGRVGKANGGMMTEDVNMMTQTPGGTTDVNVEETVDMNQGPQGPQETNEINISYDQLRDRLPPEVSDDIVLLLSQSYEALADFAELQTQADVNEFNIKYDVQLYLPQQQGA